MLHSLIRPTTSDSLNYLLPATVLLILQKLQITHTKPSKMKVNFYFYDFYVVTTNGYSKICIYMRSRFSENVYYQRHCSSKYSNINLNKFYNFMLKMYFYVTLRYSFNFWIYSLQGHD